LRHLIPSVFHCLKCQKSTGWLIDGLCDPCHNHKTRNENNARITQNKDLERAVDIVERLLHFINTVEIENVQDYLVIFEAENFLMGMDE